MADTLLNMPRKCDLSSPERLSHPGENSVLTINLAALGRNYRYLCKQIFPGRVGGVVKANAYGLGVGPVSRQLYKEGCRQFFVAELGEAKTLRELLPLDCQIFVLGGLLPGTEALAAELSIVPVLNSFGQFDRWKATASVRGQRLPAVLQFDTGMSRVGFPTAEWDALKLRVCNSANLEVMFIMSHLASADEPENSQNLEQLSLIQRLRELFPEYPTSFANSSGVFLGRQYHGDLARPGICLYGGAPIIGGKNPMEPVVSIDAAIIQIRTVVAGAKVGYGGSFKATTEMRLAIVAVGYADGIPRSLSDRGHVYHCGVRLPIRGRVSMDTMIVDISELPEGSVAPGGFVEIIGPHQTIDEIASVAGTIANEILTRLGSRFARFYI